MLGCRDCDVVDDLGEFGVGGPVVADGLLVPARAPVQQSDGGGDVAPHDPVTACCRRLRSALGFAVWGSQSGPGCHVVRAWPMRDRAGVPVRSWTVVV